MSDRRIRSLKRLPRYVEGSSGEPGIDVAALALDVLGPRAGLRDSPFVAFAYLWRRFGPPTIGSNPHRHLAGWLLTTRHNDLWLDVSPGSASLALSVAHLRHRSLGGRLYAPWREGLARYHEALARRMPGASADEVSLALIEGKITDEIRAEVGEFRRVDDAVAESISDALRHALASLLRPVRVRDHSFNVLGTISKANPGRGRECPAFKDAGYPLEVRR